MLNPVTAGLGLGASIAGSLISRSEATKNANATAAARNAVLQPYLEKQRGLETEGRGYLDKTLGTYAPGNTQLQDAQDARNATISGTVGNMSDPNTVPTTRGAPPAVKGEIAKRMLDAFQRSTAHAKALGNAGGYGDQWFNNNVDINDTSRNIGVLNNFSRGNTGILQSQQDLAEAAAYKRPSLWGSILQAGGSALLGASGRGFSLGGAAPLSNGSTYAQAFPTPIG